MKEQPLISVIIKTYNEEQGIAKTIRSIRTHLSQYPHEILVADSLSSDSTQAIAIAEGATVVSLVHGEERCCGVGHQLGYLHARGEFLLLMDGDMELEPEFIDAALEFLCSDMQYAGVAGLVEMDEASNYEFKSRKQRLKSIYPVGDCEHLGGGGLYRKSAIDEIGYLTNRNLHSCEEAELGMRLKHAGYKLHRLEVPYFHHTSYDMSSLQLLKQRWRSRYLAGPGELLRSAWGQKHFKDALHIVKVWLIYTLNLVILAISILSFQPLLILLAALPLIAFFSVKAAKNRSLKEASQSVINLTMFSAGIIRGFFTNQKDPKVAPENKIIKASE
ncbi:glycosyltransferase [Vibrio sinaloensis]|uniref:glycosyltransferase n=1 Tax=Photobacterium sp. (strain ATCC 43367) TaxID=379097 RepID=UPI0035ECBD1A